MGKPVEFQLSSQTILMTSLTLINDASGTFLTKTNSMWNCEARETFNEVHQAVRLTFFPLERKGNEEHPWSKLQLANTDPS